MCDKGVNMKFLESNGRTSGSYYGFTFERHNADDVNNGDVVWSNGSMVEVSDFISSDDLNELLSAVDNKRAFRGALIRCGFNL